MFLGCHNYVSDSEVFRYSQRNSKAFLWTCPFSMEYHFLNYSNIVASWSELYFTQIVKVKNVLLTWCSKISVQVWEKVEHFNIGWIIQGVELLDCISIWILFFYGLKLKQRSFKYENHVTQQKLTSDILFSWWQTKFREMLSNRRVGKVKNAK